MAPFTINFLLYFYLVMSVCVCYKIICINKIYHWCILICIHTIACFAFILLAYSEIF